MGNKKTVKFSNISNTVTKAIVKAVVIVTKPKIDIKKLKKLIKKEAKKKKIY